ncbi:MAG: trypsin-like peptidase domain-containing protein [Bacilli bacterium]|nr:trypsin-like peptidase domain-containing protein [Bacilli bacterium]
MKKNDTNKTLFLIIFSFIIGSIFTIFIIKWTPILNNGNNTVITKDGTHIYEKSSLAPSVEKIYNAVVLIKGYQDEEVSSTGTGFVYKVDDKYGYILTNSHVVANTNNIKVVMYNDEVVKAKFLGGDEYLDLAVLRIDKSKVSLVATLGKSEKMKLGDTVFTVGAPMGEEYTGSVTSGVLSGKDRMVSVNVSNGNNNDWVMRVLQIDASINPGNSGGPLLNANGEVIGICSMKLVDENIEGMGFAIPIEYAQNHIKSLENGKKIEWPYIGITMANVTDTASLYRQDIKIDKNIKEGVVVVKTANNSGAAKAGLKKGDVITKINGNKVKDYAYLRYELYQHQAGDTIEVTYIRNGRENKTKLLLGKSSNN